MSLFRPNRWSPLPAVAGVVGVALALVMGSPASARRHTPQPAQHVLLLSVDGLHQSDLEYYVRAHPSSALAKLTRDGAEFTHAQTPVPSDSFPGMVAQLTGGNPASTGIYYDDTWNHALLPPGTTNCAGATPGVEVTYFEQLDENLKALDGGQGLTDLPTSILQMTANPDAVIDPSQLPVDPATCKPVLVWLNDRSEAATAFAEEFLLGHSGTGNGIDGKPKPYTSSGLAHVYAGAAAAEYFHVPAGDSRVPAATRTRPGCVAGGPGGTHASATAPLSSSPRI
jgi:hypothetical protein